MFNMISSIQFLLLVTVIVLGKPYFMYLVLLIPSNGNILNYHNIVICNSTLCLTTIVHGQ